MSSGLSAAALSAAALPDREPRALDSADAIRVGVIGYGYWGPNIVRNLSALDRCEVVSVCDRNAKALKRAQKTYPAVQLTTDFAEVLESPHVDAVAIGHARLDAFRPGEEGARKRQTRLRRKTLRARPPRRRSSSSSWQARRTCESWWTTPSSSAARSGKIRELVDTRDPGPALLLRFDARVNLGLFQHDVSVVWDLAPHDLSIMDYIFREQPEAVAATGGNHFNDLADMAYITVYFPRKRHGAHQRQLAVAGEGSHDADRRPRQDARLERPRARRKDQGVRQGRQHHPTARASTTCWSATDRAMCGPPERRRFDEALTVVPDISSDCPQQRP